MATTTTELIEETRDARGRKMRTAQERDAYVQAYRTSGLTQKAFAKREGINYTTFVTWVTAAARATASGAKFTEVALPLPTRGATLEVCFADGTVVRGENAQQVATLVRLLKC